MPIAIVTGANSGIASYVTGETLVVGGGMLLMAAMANQLAT